MPTEFPVAELPTETEDEVVILTFEPDADPDMFTPEDAPPLLTVLLLVDSTVAPPQALDAPPLKAVLPVLPVELAFEFAQGSVPVALPETEFEPF